MPWTQTCAMQERVKFIIDVLDGTYTMTELCTYYGISRKTGYKWLDRHQQGGFALAFIPSVLNLAIRSRTAVMSEYIRH